MTTASRASRPRARPEAHPKGTYIEVEVICQRGTVRVRPREQYIRWVGAASGRLEGINWGDQPFSECVDAFAAAVAEERPVPVSIDHARHTLAAIEAARASARSGKPSPVLGLVKK